MTLPRRAVTVGGAALLTAGLLAGCSGGSAPGTSASGTTGAAPAPTGEAGAGFRGGFGGTFANPKVRAALRACGITVQ